MKSPLTTSLLQTIENHQTPIEKLNNCDTNTNKKATRDGVELAKHTK